MTETCPMTGRHRWHCSCGRVGLWLDSERAAKWNAKVHAKHCEATWAPR